MAVKIEKTFMDDNNSSLECYVNDAGKLYIGININKPLCDQGECVALDIADARELIAELIKCREEMEGLNAKS